jgi:hypothetical protein
MFDGHLNICKECTKRRVAIYAQTPAGKLVEKKREQTPKRKKWQVANQRIRRVKDRLKIRARNWVNNNLRKGSLVKKPCEKCGALKVEAHHPDYNFPSKINWLCPTHHRAIHAQFKRKYLP